MLAYPCMLATEQPSLLSQAVHAGYFACVHLPVFVDAFACIYKYIQLLVCMHLHA